MQRLQRSLSKKKNKDLRRKHWRRLLLKQKLRQISWLLKKLRNSQHLNKSVKKPKKKPPECKRLLKMLKLRSKGSLKPKKKLKKSSLSNRLNKRWPKKPLRLQLRNKLKLRRLPPTGRNRLKPPKRRLLRRWLPLRKLLERKKRD